MIGAINPPVRDQLDQHLHTPVHEAWTSAHPYIQAYSLHPPEEGYRRALDTLWEVFGNPSKIVASLLGSLKAKSGQFKPDNTVGLQRFALDIASALCTIKALCRLHPAHHGYDYVRLFDSKETLAQLILHLPAFTGCEFIASLGHHPENLHKHRKGIFARNRTPTR